MSTDYDPRMTADELADLKVLLQKMVADPTQPKRNHAGVDGKRVKRTHLQGLLDAIIAVDYEIEQRNEALLMVEATR